MPVFLEIQLLPLQCCWIKGKWGYLVSESSRCFHVLHIHHPQFLPCDNASVYNLQITFDAFLIFSGPQQTQRWLEIPKRTFLKNLHWNALFPFYVCFLWKIKFLIPPSHVLLVCSCSVSLANVSWANVGPHPRWWLLFMCMVFAVGSLTNGFCF